MKKKVYALFLAATLVFAYLIVGYGWICAFSAKAA